MPAVVAAAALAESRVSLSAPPAGEAALLYCHVSLVELLLCLLLLLLLLLLDSTRVLAAELVALLAVGEEDPAVESCVVRLLPLTLLLQLLLRVAAAATLWLRPFTGPPEIC